MRAAGYGDRFRSGPPATTGAARTAEMEDRWPGRAGEPLGRERSKLYGYFSGVFFGGVDEMLEAD